MSTKQNHQYYVPDGLAVENELRSVGHESDESSETSLPL